MADLFTASSAFAALHHNVNVGDWIITSGSGLESEGTDVFTRSDPSGSTMFALGPGDKILIDGSYEYGSIALNFYTGSSGSADNPIIITNFNGTAVFKSISIGGLKNALITGKYDPARQTGDPNYRGHHGDRGYAYTTGTYGLRAKPGYDNTGTSAISILEDYYFYNIDSVNPKISSTNIEVEFIEAGDGGFAGIQLKNNHWSDASGGTMYSMSIHDCYLHDSFGESVYGGHTSANGDGQHTIFLDFYNNRCLRSGRESIQLGRLGKGSRIYNNVMVSTALLWLYGGVDGGGNFQDKGLQLGFRNGGIELYNNIIMGGGSHTVFFQVDGTSDMSGSDFDHTTESMKVYNNLFYSTRQDGMYLQGISSTWSGSNIEFYDNYWGGLNYEYDITGTNENTNGFITGNNTQSAIIFRDEIKEFSKPLTRAFSPSTSRLTEINITSQSFEPILFNDSGFNDTTTDIPFVIEAWTGSVGWGTNQGDLITYSASDGKIIKDTEGPTPGTYYKVIADATNIEPSSHPSWSQYYVKMNWFDNPYPPDDYTLVSGSFWHSKGMGLLDIPKRIKPGHGKRKFLA